MNDALSALDAAIAARKADDESEFYDFGAANRMSVQLVRDYGPALRRALEDAERYRVLRHALGNGATLDQVVNEWIKKAKAEHDFEMSRRCVGLRSGTV